MTHAQKKYAVLFGVIILLAAAGPRLLQAATELARVNNNVITLEDFNRRYQETLKFFQFKAPSKKAVLDDIIRRDVALQEARRLGLDKDPEVQERMNTVLYHALLDRQLSKELEKIQITDAEAKEYYAKHPEIRTSHIFIAVRGDAKPEEDKAAFARIKKIQDEHLKPGKMSFAEVAQKYSEGVAAPMGGDIDYQTRERLDPAYYEAALKLKTPGKVSSIVRTQLGYHIIKLTGIRPWEDADKNSPRRQLFEQRRADLFENYMKDLRQKAKVTIHADLIKE